MTLFPILNSVKDISVGLIQHMHYSIAAHAPGDDPQVLLIRQLYSRCYLRCSSPLAGAAARRGLATFF
jgi:hypothetical protein